MNILRRKWNNVSMDASGDGGDRQLRDLLRDCQPD
jgi:hypothetical protein